jgi:hypothetical protein
MQMMHPSGRIPVRRWLPGGSGGTSKRLRLEEILQPFADPVMLVQPQFWIDGKMEDFPASGFGMR